MSDYLTSAELANLVGCKSNQRAAMIHWLEQNHWRFVVDKNGVPKVARAFHDRKLGVSADPQSAKYDATPNRQAFV